MIIHSPGAHQQAANISEHRFGPPESTPVISTTAVKSLMEMYRQRGSLDLDDIRRTLPIDAMSIEEVADVLAHLEEAGIPVEIDPALLTARHPRVTLREVKPTTEPSRNSERTTAAQDRLTILASSIKAARENSSRTPRSARPYVQNSGTIFVIAAALMLILLALAVWPFI